MNPAKPPFIADSYLQYLDSLSQLMVVDIKTATVYLASQFNLDKNTSKSVWAYWSSLKRHDS